MNETLLRVDQVASRLNCSRSNVYALIAAGQLLCIRIGLRAGYRVPLSSLEHYMQAQISAFREYD